MSVCLPSLSPQQTMRSALLILLLILCLLSHIPFSSAKSSRRKCVAEVHPHFTSNHTILLLPPPHAFNQSHDDELITSAREALIATKLDASIKAFDFCPISSSLASPPPQIVTDCSAVPQLHLDVCSCSAAAGRSCVAQVLFAPSFP